MLTETTPGFPVPALSVVIACTDARRTLGACLSSIAIACEGIDAEVIVVNASGDDTSAVAQNDCSIQVIGLPVGTLTPRLWAAGLARARGRAVAFTISQCQVGAGWARALLAGLESGATGAGGALLPAESCGPVDLAVFYLRYSAFLGAGERTVEQAAEIPGDNAAYRGDALQRHASSFADGFWEVDFHRRIRAEGARLVFVPGAEARFGPAAPLLSIARQRFSHGRHSGSWRIATGVRSGWQVIAAAPVVPMLLTFRIARRVLARRADRVRFLSAVPALLLLSCAWAAGEAWGAVADAGPVLARTPGLAA